MDTEMMIRELKRVEEKHKHDKVFTGQLDVAKMAYDTRKRLEELKPYEDTGLTPEQVQELKERDTAKRVKRDADDIPYCPYCESPNVYYYEENMEYDFCPDCGQRLKWEE